MSPRSVMTWTRGRSSSSSATSRLGTRNSSPPRPRSAGLRHSGAASPAPSSRTPGPASRMPPGQPESAPVSPSTRSTIHSSSTGGCQCTASSSSPRMQAACLSVMMRVLYAAASFSRLPCFTNAFLSLVRKMSGDASWYSRARGPDRSSPPDERRASHGRDAEAVGVALEPRLMRVAIARCPPIAMAVRERRDVSEGRGRSGGPRSPARPAVRPPRGTAHAP